MNHIQAINKSLIEKIAAVKNNIIEGISDLRDESDRKGVRVVTELKKDVDANIVLNQLYKHTVLQTTFNSNMLALNKGKPEQMNLKEILQSFIDFREDIISKRTIFELNKAMIPIFPKLIPKEQNVIIESYNEIKYSKTDENKQKEPINKNRRIKIIFTQQITGATYGYS